MEVWKTIKGYEDYQVSDLGNVKSLKFKKEINIKPRISVSGYFIVGLHSNGKLKTKTVHQLVAIAFLNHTPCGMKLVVNHINFNKLDNRVENLEIVSVRENSNRKHIKSSSQYLGVAWNKEKKKWSSQIVINGINKYLGCFENEIEAHEYYQNALKSHLNNKEIVVKKFKPKGYYYDKKNKKWIACVTINKKQKNLGYFKTELEAKNTYKQYQTKI